MCFCVFKLRRQLLEKVGHKHKQICFLQKYKHKHNNDNHRRRFGHKHKNKNKHKHKQRQNDDDHRSRLGRLQLVPAVAVDGKGKAATCAILQL